MTKRLNSKHKVDRRLKVNLWGRPKSPFNSRAYPPGQHGQNKKGKPTDFGTQLQAKQKLKAYYGNINERQFRNIYRKALSKRGDTTENLVALLEQRLDTLVYRAKFAPTVFSARQIINHGHIRVNKKRVNIASYVVKNTDMIEVKESSKLDNIYLKFSGFHYVDKTHWKYPYDDSRWIFEECYNSYNKKMCWGSDFPVVQESMTYKQTIEALRKNCNFIDVNDMNYILGETLNNLIKMRFS